VAELLALMDDASPLPSPVESPGEERLDAVRLRAALQKQRGRPEADRTWETASRLVPPGLAPGLVAPWDETGTVTTRAASFNPGNHELFLALSTLQARLGRRDAAQDAASLAFATWSDRGAYLRQRGEIETILGSDGEALAFYRDAVRVDPEAPQGHVALAFLYSAAGEPEPARAALIEALHRAPRYADLHYQLALVECARGELDAALGSLDAALDINPEYRVALLERAHVLCALERWAEARAAVLHVRKAGVASSDLAVRLGRIEMALGNEAEAETAWREALEIDPSQPAALRELGRLLRGQGRRDEAKTIWSRLLAVDLDEEPDELDRASGDEA
jgi:tetratricopeptide (TPR) repeat protein